MLCLEEEEQSEDNGDAQREKHEEEAMETDQLQGKGKGGILRLTSQPIPIIGELILDDDDDDDK